MTVSNNGVRFDTTICEVCGEVSYETRIYPRLALREFSCLEHHLQFQTIPQQQPYASVTTFAIAEQSA